jgi:hypothetical protein
MRQFILGLLPIRLRFALRYMVQHKRFTLLLRPRLFTEKLVLRIALDRRAIFRACADKCAMRDYIENKVGQKFLPDVIQKCTDPTLIDWEQLPSNFVVKASHGSGFVRIVKDFDAGDDHLKDSIIAECKEWLKVDYGKWSREWAYVGLPRVVIIEDFVEADYRDDDGTPWDFKCFVFGGRCEIIQVDSERFKGHRRNLYTRDWNPIDATYHFPKSNAILPKLEKLPSMIKIAEAAGYDMDFVRVDLYLSGGRVLIGELTLTPGGGGEAFSDPAVDKFLGSCWNQTLVNKLKF